MTAPFVVEIQLLPSEAGGRSGPLVSGEWRTVLGISGEHWSALLTFSGSPTPGETFRATAHLLMPEGRQYFPVGSEFMVWEGGTKGLGRVLSVAA